MIDLWQEIFGTIRRNKLRTLLTGFAVAWGIFMLIVLMGAGNGLINAFEAQSEGLNTNSMQVGGGWTSMAFDGLKEGRAIQLNNEDVRLTSTLKDNVETTGAYISQGGITLSVGDRYVGATLNGVYPNYVDVEHVKMVQGRFINPIDIRERRKVIVIDEKKAETLFRNSTNAIGKMVKAGGIMYRVVGVSQSLDDKSDTPAYISFSTLQLIYQKGTGVENIIFTIKNLPTGEANTAFEARYRSMIGAHQRFDKADDGAIWIWNRFTKYLEQAEARRILRTAIWIVGIFTLLSGIVGVSNIMLITVRERTREFGIRKALGAKPRAILWLVIVESVTITTLFGYIGMVAGIAATEYLNVTASGATADAGIGKITFFLNPTVDIGVAIEATLVLIVAGTLAGLIPARKAVRIKPIEALRTE